MFFAEKIISIQPQDKVLEIGPGASPHSRSDAFLELNFDQKEEKILQRGGVLTDAHFGKRPIYHYDGEKFPFTDNQFDYVICSHVIEHVADPASFLREVFRVGSGRGYLEYPLITYEYLYDFDVHLHFVKFDPEGGVLRYLPKSDTTFSEFAAVRSLFYTTLECGWDDLCAANQNLYFEGMEFTEPFIIEKAKTIEKLLPPRSVITHKKALRKFLGHIINKMRL